MNCAGTGNAVKTAGRDKKTGEPTHFPIDAFNRIIQINLVGTFRCIAKSAQGMLSLAPLEHGERGAVVNTASVAAEDGQMGQAAYSASKAGVLALANSLRLELDGSGVTVGTIHPSFFESALGDALTSSPLLSRASGNFTGLFAPVKREDVVAAIVKNIERRSRVAVLPRAFSALSLAPGLGQRVIEPYLSHNLRRGTEKLER